MNVPTGPDWCYGDDDGGAGSVGIVLSVKPDGSAVVSNSVYIILQFNVKSSISDCINKIVYHFIDKLLQCDCVCLHRRSMIEIVRI